MTTNVSRSSETEIVQRSLQLLYNFTSAYEGRSQVWSAGQRGLVRLTERLEAAERERDECEGCIRTRAWKLNRRRAEAAEQRVAELEAALRGTDEQALWRLRAALREGGESGS